MRKRSIAKTILLLIAAVPFVILFGLLSVGILRTYRNPTGSMEPTLPLGVRFVTILATKANRGDIVAFVFTQDPKVMMGKRVVAIAGDTVQIRAKQLFVNGRAVDEPYAIHTDPVTYPDQPLLPEPYRSRDWFGPFRVPPGTFFVLGDNRDQSADSRYWGPVPLQNLRGRVVLLYSWSRGFWKPR